MGVHGLIWLVPVAVAVLALALAVVTVAGARRPNQPLPDQAEYLRRWSRLHGGHDPTGSTLTLRWLTVVAALARPLARRGVAPTAITAWALWTAGVAVVAAAAGDRWPLLALLAVVVSGVLDNLDGAVAVLTERASRLGYVVDSLADRLADTAYVLALWFLGAPGWLCVLGGGLAAVQEYTRARAGNAGMGEIGVVTVWERPTRVIITAFALCAAGLLPDHAAVTATIGASAWAALGLVGCAQLLHSVRLHLRA